MIAYLWIDDYKNISNSSFNFDNKYIYSFDDQTNSDDSYNFVFDLSENNESLNGEFFSNNISNLSIILGENGAGKSNMLDFVIISR